MSQNADTPLVAMLQTEPDPAWQPLLDSLDDAKRSYDPQTQTGGDCLVADTTETYRVSSSGGATAYPDDGGDKSSYRASGSGGPTALTDDGEKSLYRTSSSGGASSFIDEGSKER